MPTVNCCYADTGKTLPELLEESFRLYLIRALASAEKPEGQYHTKT